MHRPLNPVSERCMSAVCRRASCRKQAKQILVPFRSRSSDACHRSEPWMEIRGDHARNDNANARAREGLHTSGAHPALADGDHRDRDHPRWYLYGGCQSGPDNEPDLQPAPLIRLPAAADRAAAARLSPVHAATQTAAGHSTVSAIRGPRDALGPLRAADHSAGRRLDRDLGLSRPNHDLLAVRAAADLAARPRVFRRPVRGAQRDRLCHWRPCTRPYRRRALPPFHSQGRRAAADDAG